MSREKRDELRAWVLECHDRKQQPDALGRFPEHLLAYRVDGALQWGVINVESDDQEPVATFQVKADAEKWVEEQQAAGELGRHCWQVFPFVVTFWYRNEYPPPQLEEGAS